jgi:glycosyltransferase involved in cell wall biosynthesis
VSPPVAAALPTISAVVVTRDRPRLLRDALASIAAQTLRPLEVRIADDGTLPAHEAASDLAGLEVTVLPVCLGQAGAARNAAAAGARGEVLAFLDDDDRWRPGHLEGLARALGDGGAGLAFRDWEAVRERVREDGAREVLERREVALEWDEARMRADDHVPPSTWGMRRDLFERLRGFDEEFRFSEDWDLLLRAAAVTTPRRVPGSTVEVRLRRGDNASESRDAERFACLRRLAERHRMPVPVPRTFWEVALAHGAAARG